MSGTSDPFMLPEGPVQIAVSGGRTSAFMLHEILRVNGPLPDRAVVTFQNTGREMPQTLDFVAEIGRRWNVHIVWLEYRVQAPFFEVVTHNSAARAGEPFEALIREYPDRAAWWERMEAKAARLTSGPAARWSKRYGRAELRRFVDRQGDWVFSTEGALCAAADGECTG